MHIHTDHWKGWDVFFCDPESQFNADAAERQSASSGRSESTLVSPVRAFKQCVEMSICWVFVHITRLRRLKAGQLVKRCFHQLSTSQCTLWLHFWSLWGFFFFETGSWRSQSDWRSQEHTVFVYKRCMLLFGEMQHQDVLHTLLTFHTQTRKSGGNRRGGLEQKEVRPFSGRLTKPPGSPGFSRDIYRLHHVRSRSWSVDFAMRANGNAYLPA